jgi:hypothetical protein
MKFETPAAFWALSSLLLLVLFSLWRQAAARVTVPSLTLWKKIPERNPPVRALRRPRWRFELLLQALAIAAAVAALAGPYRDTQEPQPIRVAFVLDTSARMRAGNRLEQAKEAARNFGAAALKADTIQLYAALPAPGRSDSWTEVVPVDEHVDLAPLLAAARSSSDEVVLFSDRPAKGAHLALFAAPADNAGIVEFSATNDEIFIRLVNHGPAKPIPVELVAGGLTIRETIPAGESRWSHRADYSKADSVRVSLGTADSFPLDNVVEATRLMELRTTVSIAGLIEPQLVKALRSIPGVTLTSGVGPAKVAIGVDAPPGPGEFRVWIFTPAAKLPGEASIAKHPLTADLEQRGAELPLGELPPGERGGEALIRVDGRTAAALRGKELRLSVDVNAWGKSLPSLPIFWANVVDVARAGASGFAVLRTGQPFQLPPGWSLQQAPEGVKPSLSPEGAFVAHIVGAYGFRTPGGPKTLRANLLEERESDTAGEARALDWDPARPAGRQPRRNGYAGAAAGLSLALLLIAWIMQLRME